PSPDVTPPRPGAPGVGYATIRPPWPVFRGRRPGAAGVSRASRRGGDMTAVPTFAGLSAVLLTTLVLTVVCPPSWQPWVQFLVAALVAAVITARRAGRPLVARERAPRRRSVDVVDLVAPDRSTVGCVEGDRVV